MQREAVSLPAHRWRVGLKQENTQELNESLLICKFVELTNQSRTQLIFLTASSISCRKHNRNIEKSVMESFWWLILNESGSMIKNAERPLKKNIKPSLSFSLSSFLLFLLEDLPWEGWDVPEPPPEDPAEAARTLLPHKAQESSCSRTGETPSSTRKLTCSRKYNTATQRQREID